MANLDYGHLTSLLEPVSAKYKNGKFKINMLLPMAHVEKRSDQILVNDKSNVFSLHETRRGLDGRSNYVSFNEHTVTFSCKNDALHTYVSDKLVKNQDRPLNSLVRATEGLTEKIMLRREYAGINFLKTVGNYVFYEDINGDWDDTTNGTPLLDINAAMGEMLVKPNCFAIGDADFRVLQQHPDFREFLTGGTDTPAIVTPEVMAKIIGVEQVIVFESVYRSNPLEPEASASWLPLWSNFAGLYYIEGLGDESFVPEVDITTFAFMANWDPEQQRRATRVNTSFNTERDGGSHFIEVECDTDIVQTIPEAAFLFQDIITAS